MGKALLESSIELVGRLLRALSKKIMKSQYGQDRRRLALSGGDKRVVRVHTDCETWHQVTCFLGKSIIRRSCRRAKEEVAVLDAFRYMQVVSRRRI